MTSVERIFPAQPASPGMAIGALVLHALATLTEHRTRSGVAERRALLAAIDRAAAQLATLAAGGDAMAAEILDFQIALLGDPELTGPALARIAQGKSAAVAWAAALDDRILDYEVAEDEYFRARAADLRDLRERVLALLQGGPAAAAGAEERDPADAIYVAEDLTPSRFLETDWTRYRGVALLGGSTTSHVAMLARARGVPLLVGVGAALTELRTGARAIIDAVAGRLIQDPAPATLREYGRRLAGQAAETAAAKRYGAAPAVTADGRRITVMMTIDDLSMLDAIDPTHSDGIGLTRTEFLFHGAAYPDEEMQARVYRRLLAWAGGRPVTIRTLDAGADKPVPGLTVSGERNPFLGLRGVRLMLARKDVFRVQIRALARAAVAGPLQVLLPMVTVPEELAETRALFVAAIGELRREGIAAALPPLGIMVEVPAAAIAIDRFPADFFSIGSNDLTQYVTAASRDNSHVARLHDPLHPAVLALFARVAAHGRATGRAVSLCGDVAARPEAMPVLLEAGLTAFSVAPTALGRTKAAIARCRSVAS